MECAGVGSLLTWIQHIVCVGIGVWRAGYRKPGNLRLRWGKTACDCRAGVLLWIGV